MAFCSNCGNEVTAAGGFCPKCGQQVSASAPGTTQPTAQPGASGTTQPASQPGAPSTTQPAAQPGAAGSGQLTSNIAGLLCYALTPITGILFLVLEPYNRDPFVRFHAFQSLFFLAATIVLIIAAGVLSAVLSVIPVLGWVLGLVLFLVLPLGLMVLWVVLMVQAYQNKKWKLPVVGDLAEKQV